MDRETLRVITARPACLRWYRLHKYDTVAIVRRVKHVYQMQCDSWPGCNAGKASHETEIHLVVVDLFWSPEL